LVDSRTYAWSGAGGVWRGVLLGVFFGVLVFVGVAITGEDARKEDRVSGASNWARRVSRGDKGALGTPERFLGAIGKTEEEKKENNQQKRNNRN
jgi:hypothetical protein